MTKTKRLAWVQQQVAGQKEWIERCGGNLEGYIARYGDPGIPPLDKDGTPRTVKVPDADLSLFQDRLTMVSPGVYYAPHQGDGGTAIYEADMNRLRYWEKQL